MGQDSRFGNRRTGKVGSNGVGLGGQGAPLSVRQKVLGLMHRFHRGVSRMVTGMRWACIVTTLFVLLLFVTPIQAQGTPLDKLTPEETVFVANSSDAALCRTFSPFLNELGVEWLILEEGELPAAYQNKDLLLIGEPSSQGTGPLLGSLLSPDEMAQIARDGWTILQKEHPWNPDRMLMLAVGSDRLTTKTAVENAAAEILDAAPSRAQWYRAAESASGEDLRTSIAEIQHTPAGDELPIDVLTVDPDASRPRSVSTEEAIEDARYLFQILEDGWCGYGTFESRGDFTAAEDAVVEQLAGQNRWSPDELEELFRQALPFVHDCHLKVGDIPYCDHQDFYYDETLSLWPAADGYHFELDGEEVQLLQVNGEAPEPFLFPSLNAAGEPIYRLGTLSYNEPAPLQLSASQGATPVHLEIPLTTADYYPREQFGEERLGGIPVIRARTFSDYYPDDLNAFLDSATRYRGEPFVILDIRGNGGGNTRWPKNWIRRFTGATPSLAQVLTELVNQTTMMGRANYFAELVHGTSDTDVAGFEADQNRHLSRATRLTDGEEAPHWSTPILPAMRLIPNDTTLIVVVDRNVASAGEGLISYLHDQVENVLVVGENSMGALTFGQNSRHQLPNSRMKMTVPIKLNVQLDLVWREEQGFLPDLWLPPDKALNYAVAAARAGTISSRITVPDDYFSQPFKPEDTGGLNLFKRWPELVPLAIILPAFFLAAVLFGRRQRFFSLAGVWLMMLGVFYIVRFDQPAGYAAVALGAASLAFSIYRLRLRANDLG